MSRSNPVTLEQALTQVRDLLDNDRPRDAIDLIAKFGANNPELRNAYGVCLMRAEEYEKALDVYRNLCVGHGVALKSDAPVVHLLNTRPHGSFSRMSKAVSTFFRSFDLCPILQRYAFKPRSIDGDSRFHGGSDLA